MLLRMLVGTQRQTSRAAIELAKVSLKNDRQFNAFVRKLREAENQAALTCLRAAQEFGYVSKEVGPEELRFMR